MDAVLNDDALYLWGKGENAFAYRALGSHRVEHNGEEAFRFAVWAPNAARAAVVGSFNGWDPDADVMTRLGDTGVYVVYIGIAHEGDTYKYAITANTGEVLYKADPFAFYAQHRPDTASVIWDIDGYEWRDARHMEYRQGDHRDEPVNIYEVHLGSWREGLSYEQLAYELVDYAVDMGYTHIELLPVMEHPLDDSWGYQVGGYYAVTSRYGTPQQFKYFVDCCHMAGIGVIADWVPAHFCRDAHGLRRFDGTPLFEHPDPRRSDQPQWGTCMFDYGRSEVRSFLISNAVFWLNEYHIDGLRVDAVSCMLYLDYGRQPGEFLPNRDGGRENLDAIEFLLKLNQSVHTQCPGALMIAEESSAYPKVTEEVEYGGLGFDLKWNMGWMNDTLTYFSMSSVYRRHHHDLLTFPMCYAFSECHVLPLSHDEVVHGKLSLIGRMPGEYADKFKQLRLLFMYQFAHPGKKLNFMGNEFGQFIEWRFDAELDWMLLDYPAHRDMHEFSRALNMFYRNTPALYEVDMNWDGFEWLAVDDARHSVIVFLRRDARGNALLCAYNFTPVMHEPYRVRIPGPAVLTRALSSVDLRPAKVESGLDAGGSFADITLLPYEGAYYYMQETEEST